MGKRRTEKTGITENVTEGMKEFIEALDLCSHNDGKPTTIKIQIIGKEEDTISMKLVNTQELAKYLKLSLGQQQ